MLKSNLKSMAILIAVTSFLFFSCKNEDKPYKLKPPPKHWIVGNWIEENWENQKEFFKVFFTDSTITTERYNKNGLIEEKKPFYYNTNYFIVYDSTFIFDPPKYGDPEYGTLVVDSAIVIERNDWDTYDGKYHITNYTFINDILEIKRFYLSPTAVMYPDNFGLIRLTKEVQDDK